MTKRLPTLTGRLAFWFTAISLLALAAMSTIIYTQRVKVARQLIFDKLSAVASHREEEIDTILKDLAIHGSTLGSDHSVMRAAKALLHGEQESAEVTSNALDLFNGYITSYDSAYAASIAVESGAILVSTSAAARQVARPEAVAEALRTLKPAYSEAYLSAADGEPTIDVAAPIISGKSRVPAAVVVHYKLRTLLKDITEKHIGMGETGETIVVNRDAVAVSGVRGSDVAVLKTKLTGLPEQYAAQGRSGIIESDDYRGRRVLAAYTFVPQTGWGVICKQDAAEIFKPIKSLLYVTYGIAALVSLFVFLFTLRITTSITRPLREVTSGAMGIGAGNYAAKIVPQGTQETRDLANSFNAMAEALQLKMDAQKGVARISEALVTAGDLDGFFGSLLPVLMEVTGAKMAGAFLEEKERGRFSPVHTIGADSSQMHSFDRQSLEGELGIILTSRSISRFTPAETGGGLRFITSFGTIAPAEIVTVPILVDDQLRAFVSLASGHPFSATAQEILNQVMVLLGTTCARVLAAEDVARLAEELSVKNAELTQQSEELVQQSTELAVQSEELARRNRELDLQKQQLEQATRLKTEFLSNMSHELRTPLNSVLALSRVLTVQGTGRLTEAEHGYLEIIERNGKHLLALINDILDLAKIESGRQELFLERASLEAIAAQVVEELEPLAREKGIALHLAPQGELPPAAMDQRRLRQILQNLVGNAVKFTAQGSVTVRLRAEGQRFVVEVQDTGIGIAPEHHEAIFQEFRQGDGSTSRLYEGTGLGLAIARKTARLMGGDVTVQSVLGRGATFTLRLPLEPRLQRQAGSSPAGTAPPEAPAVRAPLPAQERLILVVDQDREAASLVASHLAANGYRTITSADGDDVLRLARSQRPLAITLGLTMPQLAAFEAMRRLKEDPETANLPVVMVALSRDRQSALAMGAVGIVSKPVDGDNLLEQVSRLAGAGCRLVLVVDEDDGERVAIAGLLKERGMDVLLADSSDKALELAATTRPDVITVDLLEDRSGAPILRRLRETQESAIIPVIIVTSGELSGEELALMSMAGASHPAADLRAVLDELVRSLGHLEPDQDQLRKSGRILVVEDSEAATIQLRFALESSGLSVDAVSGGRHAVAYLKTHVPDGIILDLMMPEVDGFEVLKAVRNSPLTARVPVLVMTAKSLSPGEHDTLRELQVSHLLQKGDVDQKDLLRRVHEMLGGLRLFREEEAATPSPPPPAWRGDGSVLVVEDNHDNLVTLRAVLGEEYTLVEATDGEAGLAALDNCSPSLILLDMQLPVMDGLTVLKRLKAEPSTAAIPVVALTASAMSGDREKLLKAGCAEYLSKPYHVDDLLDLVRSFVKEGAPEAPEQPVGV